MMTSDINVIIYSYKGKILKDVVSSLLHNASGKRSINIVLLDQHPLNRSMSFSDIKNCSYNHIFWDWQNSPAQHKRDILDRGRSKYVLLMSDNIILNEGWDDVLVDFVDTGRGIVSGNSKLKVTQKSAFYLQKEKTDSKDFELTNFVDRSLIFFNRSICDTFKYPSYIKYNGEEETISLDLFTQGIDIYSAPTLTYTQIGVSTIEELYVPFSINHNYNEAVTLLKIGSNRFLNTSDRVRSLKDFSEFHSLDFSNIRELPFQTNDVSYDPMMLDFNSVDARRFVARTKSIH